MSDSKYFYPPDDKPLFLGTPPKYFGVHENAINGLMDEGRRAYLARPTFIRGSACTLWKQYAAFIAEHHGKLIRGTPDPRCFDHVFNADQLVAFIDSNGEKIALMSRMKYPQRQLEVESARKTMRAHGFRIVESDCVREGSGDTLFDSNYGIWFTGVGQRTAPGAGKLLSQISGRPVIEIPTLSRDYYHLDTFQSPLPLGHVVAYKDAMTPASFKLLKLFYPNDGQVMEISKYDAMSLCTNLQYVTETSGDERIHSVMVPKNSSSQFQAKLTERGYRVVPFQTKALLSSGGGGHCTIQQVHDLRKHPLQALPADLIDFVLRHNHGVHPDKKIRVWKDGKLLTPTHGQTNQTRYNMVNAIK